MHTNPIPVPPEEYRTLPLAANGAVEAAAEIHPHQRAQSEAEKPCQHCGGSGILRKNSESYRTCLTCLGQGTLPSTNGLVFPLLRPVSSPAASR